MINVFIIQYATTEKEKTVQGRTHIGKSHFSNFHNVSLSVYQNTQLNYNGTINHSE